MKVLFVIVLFNQRLEECQTYKSLISKYRQYNLFIFDNSPIAQHRPTEFVNTNIYYASDVSNPGLSYAYNRALEHGKRDGFDWVLLMDQDTSFPEGVIANYINAINKYSYIKMCVPRVISSGDKIISPILVNSYFNCKGVDVNSIELDSSKYVAINSGMMVNIEAALDVGGYNEAVWLDHSDFQFVERFSKRYKTFYVIDSVCVQDLSTETNSNSQRLNRFKIFCSCIKACDKVSFGRKVSYVILVIKRAIKLLLQTKSPQVLNVIFKYYF